MSVSISRLHTSASSVENDNGNFGILDGGKEVQGIDLTPGYTSVWTLKKQFATGDSDASINGNNE